MKKIIVFFLQLLIFCFFIGCKTDLLTEDVAVETQIVNDFEKGSFGFSFILPDNHDSSKSARPTLPNSLSYKCKLDNDSSERELNFTSTGNYIINGVLAEGNHTITVYAYSGANRILQSDETQFTVKPNGSYDAVIKLDYIPASSSTYKGFICLPVEIGDSYFARFEIITEGTQPNPYNPSLMQIVSDDPQSFIEINDIQTPVCCINFYIYKGNGTSQNALVYKTQLNFNIYANLRVDTWNDYAVNNIVNNTLTFTKDQLDAIFSRNIYVEQGSNATEAGDGTFTEPYNCFGDRFYEKLDALFNMTSDEVTVYCEGTSIDLNKNIEIPAGKTLKIMSVGTDVSKITGNTTSISGANHNIFTVNGNLILDNIEISNVITGAAVPGNDDDWKKYYAIYVSSTGQLSVCGKVIVQYNGLNLSSSNEPYDNYCTDIYIEDSNKIKVLGPILTDSKISVYFKGAEGIVTGVITSLEITDGFNNITGWIEQYTGQTREEAASKIFFSYVEKGKKSKEFLVGVKASNLAYPDIKEVNLGLVKGSNDSLLQPKITEHDYKITLDEPLWDDDCSEFLIAGSTFNTQSYVFFPGVFIVDPGTEAEFQITVRDGTHQQYDWNEITVKVYSHGNEILQGINAWQHIVNTSSEHGKIKLHSGLPPEKYQIVINYHDVSVQYSIIYNLPRFFDSNLPYGRMVVNGSVKKVGMNNMLILDIQDLLALQGKTIRYCNLKLEKDIDLGGIEWDGFILENSSFDGNGHTISGIICSKSDYVNNAKTNTADKDRGGFIQNATGETGSNIKIQNLTIEGKSNVTGLLGYGKYVDIENCTNKMDIKNSGSPENVYYMAGICGNLQDGYIEKCRNYGDVDAGTGMKNGYVGGICAYNSGNVYNCENFGNITGSYKVGGIVGYLYYINSSNGEIKNCINHGNINFYNKMSDYGNKLGVSGICSVFQDPTQLFSNCLNMGKIVRMNSVNGQNYYDGDYFSYIVTWDNAPTKCFAYDPWDSLKKIQKEYEAQSKTCKTRTVPEFYYDSTSADKFLFYEVQAQKWSVIEYMNYYKPSLSLTGGYTACDFIYVDDWKGEPTIMLDF